LDLAQTSKRCVLLLPIVLVIMDLVVREFVPVYYHNALLIVVLVLIVTARDMVGVGYLVVGVSVMLWWHVSVVKIPSKAKMRKTASERLLLLCT
jgi:hypothetical protein